MTKIWPLLCSVVASIVAAALVACIVLEGANLAGFRTLAQSLLIYLAGGAIGSVWVMFIVTRPLVSGAPYSDYWKIVFRGARPWLIFAVLSAVALMVAAAIGASVLDGAGEQGSGHRHPLRLDISLAALASVYAIVLLASASAAKLSRKSPPR